MRVLWRLTCACVVGNAVLNTLTWMYSTVMKVAWHCTIEPSPPAPIVDLYVCSQRNSTYVLCCLTGAFFGEKVVRHPVNLSFLLACLSKPRGLGSNLLVRVSRSQESAMGSGHLLTEGWVPWVPALPTRVLSTELPLHHAPAQYTCCLRSPAAANRGASSSTHVCV